MTQPKMYSQERLTQVLLAPVVSEKSTFVGEKTISLCFESRPMPPSRK